MAIKINNTYRTVYSSTHILTGSSNVYCDNFLIFTVNNSSQSYVLNTLTGKLTLDIGTASGSATYNTDIFKVGTDYFVVNKRTYILYKYDTATDTFVSILTGVTNATFTYFNNTPYIFVVTGGFHKAYYMDNNVLTATDFPAYQSMNTFNTISGYNLIKETKYDIKDVNALRMTNTITTYEFLEWEQINSFPTNKDMYITVGNNGSLTRDNTSYIYNSILLVNQKYTDETYNNSLELTNEILGEEAN